MFNLHPGVKGTSTCLLSDLLITEGSAEIGTTNPGNEGGLIMPIKPENRKRYPSNWKDIRNKILMRANNRCEFCGVENHSYVPKAGTENWEFPEPVKVVLTIAHLDHTPENCDPENLRALCQKCHNRYDAEHRRATRSHTRALKDKSLELFEK